MARIFGASDSAARLERAQAVVADTRLASLALAAGDAIQASAEEDAEFDLGPSAFFRIAVEAAAE